MGCHIDGFIAVVAHMHVLQDGPVNGRAADVIAAANTAAGSCFEACQAWKELGRCKAVRVFSPETRVDDAEFKENEVYAVDIVTSTGDGKPKLLDESRGQKLSLENESCKIHHQ
ncbi:hypothetical protein LWI29_011603 [Acer saccharum]|uniref:Peptidase M24 domain-containing protein n=1 Tax=Acer saccharum TaxID=4024 RepID=A0AA39TDS8_ACESA|nr:hypothetical protein LWI29_011603 [Acer saccharum]